MNIYVDTEFNGFGGRLISMAMVTEDQQEWYEVLPTRKSSVVPWVAQNVIPVLNKVATRPSAFKASFEDFVKQYINITFIADWPEDIKHICDNLILSPGRTIYLPKVVDFRICTELSNNYVSAIPHNALSDARALRANYRQYKWGMDLGLK